MLSIPTKWEKTSNARKPLSCFRACMCLSALREAMSYRDTKNRKSNKNLDPVALIQEV